MSTCARVFRWQKERKKNFARLPQVQLFNPIFLFDASLFATFDGFEEAVSLNTHIINRFSIQFTQKKKIVAKLDVDA